MATKKEYVTHLVVFGNSNFQLHIPCDKRNPIRVSFLITAAIKTFDNADTLKSLTTSKHLTFDMRKVTCKRCLKRIGSGPNWAISKSASIEKKRRKSEVRKLANLINKPPSLI